MEMHCCLLLQFFALLFKMAFRVFIFFKTQFVQCYDFEELMKIPLKLEGDQHQGHGVKPQSNWLSMKVGNFFAFGNVQELQIATLTNQLRNLCSHRIHTFKEPFFLLCLATCWSCHKVVDRQAWIWQGSMELNHIAKKPKVCCMFAEICC